jgi:hypothetical protein
MGILEQSRSYAIAQNTYVWVVFYPQDPSTLTPADSGGDALYVTALASNDGTDPLGWSGATVDMTQNSPVTIAGTTTTIAPIFPTAHISQMAVRTQNYFTQGSGAGQIASLPSDMPASPTTPAATPTFQISVNHALTLPAALPADALTAQSSLVIQFTPTGAARVSGSPIDSIWVNFQRAKAKGVIDSNNIAALQINGLIGLTTVYRK